MTVHPAGAMDNSEMSFATHPVFMAWYSATQNVERAICSFLYLRSTPWPFRILRRFFVLRRFRKAIALADQLAHDIREASVPFPAFLVKESADEINYHSKVLQLLGNLHDDSLAAICSSLCAENASQVTRDFYPLVAIVSRFPNSLHCIELLFQQLLSKLEGGAAYLDLASALFSILFFLDFFKLPVPSTSFNRLKALAHKAEQSGLSLPLPLNYASNWEQLIGKLHRRVPSTRPLLKR
jgi:hypothetical protein